MHAFSTVVPSNAKALCTVSPANFATWFPGGVTLDGAATEANSVTFSDVPNCDFYEWSWRMFLWLLSPAPPHYSAGSGTRTFQSRIFYAVSAPDVAGARMLISHPSGVSNVLLPEQAFGPVLMAQGGSLVYYSRQINDVLAWFRALVPNNPQPVFPTTQADLDDIEALASASGTTLPDANALAIEVKSSWVEASTLVRPGSYVTMMATIPTYATSNTLWTRTGTKTVLMAMTAMSVVGSTKGHPEMIWATFDHLDNSPNATFNYVNTTNTTVTVPVISPTGPNWLFTGNGLAVPSPPQPPFNNQRMFYQDPNIQATPSSTVGPSDILRMKPWGAASDVNPNFRNPANSNTEIISINNSIHGMMQTLAAGDVRNNYFMTGATWTIGGASPTGPFPDGNEVGTSRLASTTMETFLKGSDHTASGEENCFRCHGGSLPGGSAVFNQLPQASPPASPAVPILSEWGMAAFTLLMLMAGAIFIYRRSMRMARRSGFQEEC